MLPLEIVELIWDHMSKKELLKCIVVCQLWYRRLIPRLYSKLEVPPMTAVRSSSRESMMQTLLSVRGQIYLEHVYTLKINVSKLRNVDPTRLEQLLANCRNVKRLKLVFSNLIDLFPSRFLDMLTKSLPLDSVEHLTLEGLELDVDDNFSRHYLFQLLLAMRSHLSSLTLVGLEESLPDRILALLGWPGQHMYWKNAKEADFSTAILRNFRKIVENHNVFMSEYPCSPDDPVFEELCVVQVFGSRSCSEAGAAAIMIGPGCPKLMNLRLVSCYSCVLDEHTISLLNQGRCSRLSEMTFGKVNVYCDAVDMEGSESDDGDWEWEPSDEM